jgi:hypothetical protein
MQEQLEQDKEIQNIAEEITRTMQQAYDTLIERRDRQYEDAIAPLDAEEQSLRGEYVSIRDVARNLELLLPAREREAQRQADTLLLDGKQEEAAAKIAESEEARTAPEAMKERQRKIDFRLTAIEEDRKTIARRIFETWHGEVCAVIRAAEAGLFIELLDKAKDEMYAYQDRRELHGTLDRPYSNLIKDAHLQNLTAHERSAEWRSGQNWYGGRR